jgi:succinate dehydrogenase / fumarate reductase, cytochrome b subunit
MSIKTILTSSIVKKVWMALTGLFLCTFLIGHLAGNMQLILKTGEEGRRAFNEYAYFMAHNPFIKVLSYVTYFSIIFHAFQGFYLTYQNKQARPQGYAYSKPGANSALPSRYMAVLGTLILVFIVTHMANFWWKAKITEEIPLHTYYSETAKDTLFYTVHRKEPSVKVIREMGEIEGNKLVYSAKKINLQLEQRLNQSIAQAEQAGQAITPQQIEDIKKQNRIKNNEFIDEGYKDLHTVVMDFFNPKKNELAMIYMLLYVFSMGALAFHLWHGFASGFQSLGLNHKRYTPLIHNAGKLFAVLVPGLFALITVLIYLK